MTRLRILTKDDLAHDKLNCETIQQGTAVGSSIKNVKDNNNTNSGFCSYQKFPINALQILHKSRDANIWIPPCDIFKKGDPSRHKASLTHK